MAEIKHLEKGEVLIHEGDQSASLYWLQRGSLRLYKKNNTNFIELGFLKEGELVGEMSFLDNEPRSASVEALQPCDLIEIPRGKFDEIMKNQPTWLNTLVQTLVRRLRTTNNRLREIETASAHYSPAPSQGQNQNPSELITNEKKFSIHDILKLTTAILLAGSRRAEKQNTPHNSMLVVNSSWFHLYAGGLLGQPVLKATAYLEILQEAGVLQLQKEGDTTKINILSLDFLEHFAQWLHNENLKKPNQRIDLSGKATIFCDLIYQYGDLAKFGAQEIVDFDFAQFLDRVSKQLNTTLPVDSSSVAELAKFGLAEGTGKLNIKGFKASYPCINLRQRFLDYQGMQSGM